MRRTLVTIAVAGALGALAWSAVRSVTRVECELCMRYGGRTACRTVRAATAEEARAGALANACAILATGMTDGLRCQRTPPLSVECRER